MARHKDPHPWLDWFDVLERYKRNGFLELQPGKNEAYITLPALHALTPGDDPASQLESGAVLDTMRRIRAYVIWTLQRGPSILAKPFALHVVKDGPTNDLIYTILVTKRRRWWIPWTRTERIEIIDYMKKNK